MPNLVLIDGNAIIHRAYHAIPKTFSNRKGEQTNVSYGFATTLIKVLEDLKPEYIAATFDLPGGTFRHQVFADYKATRIKADQELYDQIPRVKQLVSAFGIPIYEKEGFEADDCLGTIVQKIQDTRNKIQTNSKNQNSNLKYDVIARDEAIYSDEIAAPPTKGMARNDNNSTIEQFNNLTIFIVSGDKDIFQLVNGNVKVYNLKKGLSQTQIVDSEVIQKEYNLQPSDFIDLKALAGDPSDNIPGVPGIGPKTATQLLQTYDTLENIYATIEKFQDTRDNNQTNSNNQILNKENITDVIARDEAIYHKEIAAPPTKGMARDDNNLTIQQFNDDTIETVAREIGLKPRIVKLLIENKEQAFLSQHLATIHRDVPIDFDLEKSRFGQYDKDALRKLFEELGFQSLLKRFGASDLVETSENQASAKQKTDVQQKDEQLKLL